MVGRGKDGVGPMRFALLGSGSSGNALLVAGESAKILIDNGLSYRQLVLRCEAVGECLDGLAGVFVTHEHGDHVNGVGILARKLDVPVFMTRGTHAHLPRSIGRLPRVEVFDAGETLEMAGFALASFSVTHDAADPVCYVVRDSAGRQLGMATDLGQANALVRKRLAGSHALVLESNYCPRMLRDSIYPASIRQRIHSAHGHLSNAEMNGLLADLFHAELGLVVLVHVSQENNTEELARKMAAQVLANHRAELHVAVQNAPTPFFTVAPPPPAVAEAPAAYAPPPGAGVRPAQITMPFAAEPQTA